MTAISEQAVNEENDHAEVADRLRRNGENHFFLLKAPLIRPNSVPRGP